jgi:hypothetical protein
VELDGFGKTDETISDESTIFFTSTRTGLAKDTSAQRK